MKKENMSKYIIFFAIVIAGVFADQWTKWYAEQRLATQRPGHFTHEMVLSVPDAFDDQTLETYLTDELAYNTPDEIKRIMNRSVMDRDGKRMIAGTKLEAGQEVRILRRNVVIIENYWDFQYTRNPGAAFSFLADQDPKWKRPFFILMTLLALGTILFILKGAEREQKLMPWGLGFIAAGAIGNFIDRLRFDYVIDFIFWKYTDAYPWPIFNIADSWIWVGVGLMMIEIGLETRREKLAKAAEEVGEGGDEAEEEAAPA